MQNSSDLRDLGVLVPETFQLSLPGASFVLDLTSDRTLSFAIKTTLKSNNGEPPFLWD